MGTPRDSTQGEVDEFLEKVSDIIEKAYEEHDAMKEVNLGVWRWAKADHNYSEYIIPKFQVDVTDPIKMGL